MLSPAGGLCAELGNPSFAGMTNNKSNSTGLPGIK